LDVRIRPTGSEGRKIHVHKEAHPQDQELHIHTEEKENPKKTTKKVSSSPISLYSYNGDYFAVCFFFAGTPDFRIPKR